MCVTCGPRCDDAADVELERSTAPSLGKSFCNGTQDHGRLSPSFFADGTCGFGLDGEAISRTEVGVSVDGPFQIILESRSHGTVMLHGPLEVWEGVRGDMDWRQ